MKRTHLILITALMLVGTTDATMAADNPLEQPILKLQPQADENGDGKLSKAEEATLHAKILKRFPQADADGDGILSIKEQQAVVRRTAARAKPQGGQTPRAEADKAKGLTPPTPLAIYIHGGGFRAGSKEKLRQNVLNELLEGGIHVPFIVSWPAQLEGGKECDVPKWSIDLFATALDAAGLPMPKDKPLDGKSILPALKGDTDKLHDELYWSSVGANGKWAVRFGNWKLIAVKNRFELFDLEKDLSETTDLAAKHPKVVSELTDKYNAWLDEMADPVSKPKKRWNPDARAPAKI